MLPGKLIVCYDDNHITIDGDTKLSFTEGKCLTHFLTILSVRPHFLYAHCVYSLLFV